jgi:hypothetical protein
MLQVALGGYSLFQPFEVIYDTSPMFYEPGYNIMSALEIVSPKADQVSILVRDRSLLTPDNFSDVVDMDFEDYSFSCVDTVSEEGVDYFFRYNEDTSAYSRQTSWTEADTGFIIEISNSPVVDDANTRIRSMDCLLTNNITNDFIRFRVVVEDESKLFYYLAQDQKALRDREPSSLGLRQTNVDISLGGDTHIIISPFASFVETSKDLSDFSYPLNTIYYSRQDLYNNEDFLFAVRCSDPIIASYFSIFPLERYHKVGILIIPKNISDYVITLDRFPYVDVSVYGIISEMEDTMRIYLSA